MRNPTRLISIDIGSTHTKSALFELDGANGRLLARHAHPTTQEDLGRGAGDTLRALLGGRKDDSLERLRADTPVRLSSSAKGGLSIVAIGLVPELTLELARMAAMSAGGKVVGSYAYSLTQADMRAIETRAPDILLLAGGTDGGHTDCVLRNAARIAESSFSGPVLYAGNRAAADEVAALLRHKSLAVADNIMPAMRAVEIEPARQAIRRIFLERIVAGKGLARLAEQLGTQPQPTPLGVLRLVEAIPAHVPAWTDFCVVDLGGATTDFYSHAEPPVADERVVIKGVPEPHAKRTVEGDLGLRVSAPSVREEARELVATRLAEHRLDETALNRYMETIAAQPGHIAAGEPDETLDGILAEACVRMALERHAGRYEEAYTPQGKIFVQTGKDLRGVKRVIGSGGFLSVPANSHWLRRAFAAVGCPGRSGLPLVPEAPAFHADRAGLFPLLGNLADLWPEAAARLAVATLADADATAPGPPVDIATGQQGAHVP